MSHDTDMKENTASPLILFFAAPLMGAAAGGMGWGIRGQYGHEWGVMVPGVLIAFTSVFLFCKRAAALHAARAVALTAIGFSFGGTMTYGQTVGLTHDTPLVGNTDGKKCWDFMSLSLCWYSLVYNFSIVLIFQRSVHQTGPCHGSISQITGNGNQLISI